MSAPEDDVVYGLLTLAGMDVALPLSALREVVPCPAELAGLPASATGLLGAMSLRSLVLPVVDLRPAIGAAAERGDDQVVVVVAHGGAVLGLLADQVRGVTRVPGSALMAMGLQGGADGRELLFSHAFQGPVVGSVVSVLDAGALLRLPGVPTVADAEHGATGAGSPQGTTAPARTLTLVRCGPHVLALDVAQVHTTLPSSAVRPSVLDGGLCRGVLHFAGRQVPVVDPLALLGLGVLPSEDTGAGLVLDLGTGYVVLALTALLDLTELARDDVLPLPAFAVPRPDLVVGMADVSGTGQCLVLDGPALLADRQLAALAAVNTVLADAGAPERAGAAAAASGQPYLTYSAGVDVATPLEQVAEILPRPVTATSTNAGGALLGIVVHRRAAVPVLDLAALLGRTPAPLTAASCVLLVAVDGDSVAFAVDGLSTIEPLTWSDPEPPARDPSRVLGSSPLVQVGTQNRLLPDLDLRALARAVRHSDGSPARTSAVPALPTPSAPLDDALGLREPLQ